MELNFDDIEDAQDFSPLDPGRYPARIIAAEPRTTNSGSPSWSLTFQVEDGHPGAGRRFFDNLVFAGGGLKRAKLVLGRLGMDTTGTKNIEPGDILDARAMVDVEIEEYEKTGEDGEQKKLKRNKVPYAGYHSIDDLLPQGGGAGGASALKADMPF